jgi:hypothetical protein
VSTRTWARFGTARRWWSSGLSSTSMPLKDRLGMLGSVTRNVTRESSGPETEIPAHSDLQTGQEVPEWARRRVPVYGRVNARPLAPERRLDPP